MVCLYCRRPIGILRRIKDTNFCCNEHRQKLVSGSARALRDAEDFLGPEAVAWQSIDRKPGKGKPGQATTIFVVLAIVFLVLAVSDLPVGNTSYVSPIPNAEKQEASSGLGSLLAHVIQAGGSGTMRDDFKSGTANWEGLAAGNSDWALNSGYVRPGRLRIWNQSEPLSNYEFEFMGQIQRKSMDWAFRAADLHNYYGTKIAILHPGPLPNAGLVRFVVIDGRERERVELPLPLTLESGVDYRVRVSVRDNRFLTSVNGQLVSSWTDSRLSRGGVGFFADEGETALVKWVTVSERDSVVGRIVSHFSLISFPALAGPNL